MEQPREYYVYAYLRSKDSVNGTKGSPYYIGKGKRYRANNQEHSVSLPAEVRWKESATGHEVTEETKKKISLALTGKKLGPRNWTEEQRIRFSETRKGIRPAWLDDPDWKEKQIKLNQSDEHRNKIREGMIRYWSSEEGLQRRVSRT